MKLVQRYPLHYNSRHTYELTDTAVLDTYEAWDGFGRYEYRLDEISPVVTKISQGDKSLKSIGGFLVGSAIAAGLLLKSAGPALQIGIFIALLSLGIACGLLYVFKKYNYEVFKNKSGELLFGIKLTKSGTERSFLDELKRRIA